MGLPLAIFVPPFYAALFQDSGMDAATALGITSESLKKLGLVDEVIKEPLGGAHKEPEEVVRRVADCLEKQLEELGELTLDEMLEQRYQRLLSYGEFQD